jgi:hypothetical protein
MEKIQSIKLTLTPVEGVFDAMGRQEFDFSIKIETIDGSEPRKSGVLYLLRQAIETIEDVE